MNVQEQLQEDMKTAMKAKDQASLRSIRAIKAALLIAATEKGADGKVSDEKVMQTLQKMVKQRRDSLTIFEEQDRAELAQTEREEIEVIERYLPKQLSEDELKAIVSSVIEKTGASSIKDMGKVMGAANKEIAGRADGKAVASMIKELLNA